MRDALLLPIVLLSTFAHVGTARADGERLALMPVTFEGVAAVVPERARDVMAEAAVGRGFQLLPTPAVIRAMAQAGLATGEMSGAMPSAADLFRVTVTSGAERGLHCRIYIEQGSYAADLLVASIDGTGPFRAHVVGGADDFLERLAATVVSTLPDVATFDITAAARYRGGPVSQAAAPRFAPIAVAPPLPIAPLRARGPRYGVTVGYEASIGAVQGERFSHHLLNARIDFHLSPSIVLGLSFGYVNLDLGASRGSNLLGLVQIEDRLRFHSTGRVIFPIRFAAGYLPRNGPVMRFSGGLRFPAGDRWEVGADLIAPTFYWVPGERRVAYDVGAEATYRFGPSDE